MTSQELLGSVISLAVQGKLVPQLEVEGSADALYNHLVNQKLKLIKQGFAKKSKTLSPISEEEKLFEIPSSWRWIKLGEISSVITKGTTPRGGNVSYLDAGIGFLRAENVAGLDKLDKTNLKYIDEDTHLDYLKRSILEAHDILITIAGTLGRTAIVREEDLPLNANQAVSMVRLVDPAAIDLTYLVYSLNSPEIQRYLTKQKKVTAIPNLTLEIIENCLVPLPPLAEQKRIVAKLEDILPLIDRYEAAWNKLEEFNKRFPGDMQKSILQLAIQGKLVEQHSDEGTGEELFQKIQAEKQALIKAGKIKKEKPLQEIADNEIPFDIPDTWKWTRVAAITTLNPKNDLEDDLEIAFIPMPCVMDGFRNQHNFEIKKWKEIKKGFTHFADGDIGVAKITPCFQNRKSVIFRDLINGYGAGTTELTIVRPIGNTVLREYLLWFFKSDHFITNGVKSFTGTAGQQRIHKDYLATCPIPLPPLEEQRRIVAKLEELLPLCDRLK